MARACYELQVHTHSHMESFYLLSLSLIFYQIFYVKKFKLDNTGGSSYFRGKTIEYTCSRGNMYHIQILF